jgi:GMP synthase-like glutamine amidotransferase
LADGESDVKADFGDGYLKEWGYTAVDVLDDQNPVFADLALRGRSPVFLEAHYCEAKSVPEGFELLASTPMSRIQALRRSGTIVYGTQFHPEAYIEEPGDGDNCLIRHVYPDGYDGRQPDGRRFLVNFFRAAGIRR